jgi:hypothetical protein
MGFESHAQLSPHYMPTFPKWHGHDFDPQHTDNNSLVKLMYLIMKKEYTRMSYMYYGTLFILFVCHIEISQTMVTPTILLVLLESPWGLGFTDVVL